MCDVWLDFLYFLTKKGGRGVGAVVFFFYVFYYNAIRTLDYFLILLLSLNCHLTSLLISYSPPKSQHTPSYLKHPQHDINQPNQHKNHKYHNTSKLPYPTTYTFKIHTRTTHTSIITSAKPKYRQPTTLEILLFLSSPSMP